MEQNSQNRRSYSNERNTNQDQDRYNQGYGNFRGYDSDNDEENRNNDYGNRSNQDSRNNDYGSGRNYGLGSNRGNSMNESGWNNWSHQNKVGSDDNRTRNSGFNQQNSNDYNRNYNDRNRDFDSFGGSNSSGNYGGGQYGQETYRSGNSGSFEQDFGRNRDSNSDRDRGQRNMNQWNNDFNRSNEGGRFNQSDDFGRNRNGRNNDYRNNGGNNDRDWWDRTKDEVSSWFGDDDAQRRRQMDDRNDSMQSHRGKGPKDYKRSNERIREDVSDRLSDAHDVDASNIEVKVDGTEVILSGHVNSKNEKRRAEDIAEGVSGVSNVQNHLRVGQQKQQGIMGGQSSHNQVPTTTGEADATLGQKVNSSSYGSGSSVGSATDVVDTKNDKLELADNKGTIGNSTSATGANQKSETGNTVKPEKANLS